MRLNQTLGDRHPQTGSTVGSGTSRVTLGEALEHIKTLGKPRTLIDDPHGGVSSTVPNLDPYMRRSGRMPDGIVEEVPNHPSQLALATQYRYVMISIDVDLNASPARHRCHGLNRFVGQISQVDGFGADIQFPGLDLSQEEEVFNETRQQIEVGQHRPQVAIRVLNNAVL